MGCEGNAGDLGALGAGHLGYRQRSITYAPCDDHKTRPVREDVRTSHPLYQHIAQQEENALAEEYEPADWRPVPMSSSAVAFSSCWEVCW